jgi:hypothetical protein
MTLLLCPVCVGDPASPMTQAAQAGVLFLLGVVVVMLGAIGAIAFSWARRAKRLSLQQSAAPGAAAGEAPSPLATA